MGRRAVGALDDTPVEFEVEDSRSSPCPAGAKTCKFNLSGRYRSGLERSTLNVPPSCRGAGRGAVSTATNRRCERALVC